MGTAITQPLTGHYFTYCQFCVHDGKCELRHCEFLGLPSAGEKGPGFHHHEEIVDLLTIFQENTPQGCCNGRIVATDSPFIRLRCECGVAVSSLGLNDIPGGTFCHKFQPNEPGQARQKIAQEIASQRGISLCDVTPEDLPAINDSYHAVLT